MDIVTQGLLGAATAQAVAKPNQIRAASVVGFLSPLLADADALIQSATDPLLFLEYHRFFTHALLFIPFGALLASFLLWPFMRKKLPFSRIYFYAFFAYATAGILDACTSYGTQLLWPFSDARIAWSIIAIFDPLFSLLLIVAIVWAVLKRKPFVAQVGLLFVVAYLLLGVVQKGRATQLAEKNAAVRGHNVERLVIKPTMGNLLLWRVVYQNEKNYYVDALRVGLFSENHIFKGDSIAVFNLQQSLPSLPSSTTHYKDIERFRYFSDGFLIWHPAQPHVLGDVRFAMLPTTTAPLWGIKLDLSTPHKHVTFETYRTISRAQRQVLIEMIFGVLGTD